MRMMLYFLEGVLVKKSEKFIVVENQGFGFRIFVSRETLERLPKVGEKVKIFLYFYLREEAVELYGFLNESELEFFELLNSVAGIGPKSALALIGSNSLDNLKSAIIAGKTEVLTRTPGIGRKTAERIILELKSKLEVSEEGLERLESDLELENALLDLGYSKEVIRRVIKKIPQEIGDFNKRLKEALKLLGEK